MGDPEETHPYITMPVHYVSYGTPGGEFPSVCRCAFVTATDPDDARRVDLCVLNPTGFFFNQRVTRDEEDRGKGGSWHDADRCPN